MLLPPISGTAQPSAQEHRCRAGAVCSVVVAHHTISQVRPAQHTVRVLEAPHYAARSDAVSPAFRPCSSSTHPNAHHPCLASIRPSTPLPPPRTPNHGRRARRKPCNAGLDAAAPSPRPPPVTARPGPAHAAAPSSACARPAQHNPAPKSMLGRRSLSCEIK